MQDDAPAGHLRNHGKFCPPGTRRRAAYAGTAHFGHTEGVRNCNSDLSLGAAHVILFRPRNLFFEGHLMLDALKSLAGGGKAAQKQAEELEALIATAREERSALSAMLTQVTMRSGKLTETAKTLDDVGKKAGAATDTLDTIATRLGEVQRQAATLADIEKRAQSLDSAIRQAQDTTEKLIAPNGELERHRRDIQGVANAALEVQ